MDCPECAGRIKVTHTFSTGQAFVRRRECRACYTVLVTTETITSVNPPRGGGAEALAKQMELEEGEETEVRIAASASAQ